MSPMKLITTSLGIICTTLLAPTPALSQTESAIDSSPEGDLAGLEEIVVSARRRAENLQDVPISIVARSGEYLARSKVDGVTELSRVVPGFVFDEFEAGHLSTATLRGLSTYSFEVHTPQSVGIVVDDVVLGAVGASQADFNDINRVEVLRGPQGTLFGRNTTGGVVHFITNDPIDEFEAKASLGYGSYQEVKWNGTINVPLTDKLWSRTSVFTSNRDGHIENINNGQMLEGEQQFGIRGKLLYAPNPDTQIKLMLGYINRERVGLASPVVAFGSFAPQEDIEVNAGIAGPENDKVNGVGGAPLEAHSAFGSLIWDQALGEFELRSISALEYWNFILGSEDELFRMFNDPIEPLFWHIFHTDNDLLGWSQEVRLASPAGERVEYVVGTFISGSTVTERRNFLGNVSDDPNPAAAVYVFDIADQDPTKHLDYAVFGEADIHLADNWTLTTGLRWTRDETEVTVNAEPAPFLIPELGFGIGPLGELYIPVLDSEFPGTRSLDVSASEWTWRLGLRWQPTENVMAYSSAARGFKGPTITQLTAPLRTVEPEIVMSYEIGVKAELLNNTVSTGLTAFRADIDDLQAQGVLDVPLPGGVDETIISVLLTNAAVAKTQGVEFELSASPTDQLTFDLALAYIDATFESYPNAACFSSQTVAEGCVDGQQDLSGRPLPLVPELAGNAALNYDFRLPFWDLNQFVRLDYSYRDEIYWSTGLEPLSLSEAVGTWGMSLALSSQDTHYEIVAFVKNLTDEYVVNGLSGGNETIEANLQPEYGRTWGVTFGLNFQ